ncbi:hypothetical protein GH714_010636 [Hevea brasiliensis]|uniref:Uncharacterized protein n=1 Tax=Hevea brasiliensis TaxID=3981 RepID=A0A6A6KMY3_HEVBR|nr:hypothetical protein GH714_010636 [Hevea brasiliensis]
MESLPALKLRLVYGCEAFEYPNRSFELSVDYIIITQYNGICDEVGNENLVIVVYGYVVDVDIVYDHRQPATSKAKTKQLAISLASIGVPIDARVKSIRKLSIDNKNNRGKDFIIEVDYNENNFEFNFVPSFEDSYKDNDDSLPCELVRMDNDKDIYEVTVMEMDRMVMSMFSDDYGSYKAFSIRENHEDKIVRRKVKELGMM